MKTFSSPCSHNKGVIRDYWDKIEIIRAENILFSSTRRFSTFQSIDFFSFFVLYCASVGSFITTNGGEALNNIFFIVIILRRTFSGSGRKMLLTGGQCFCYGLGTSFISVYLLFLDKYPYNFPVLLTFLPIAVPLPHSNALNILQRK